MRTRWMESSGSCFLQPPAFLPLPIKAFFPGRSGGLECGLPSLQSPNCNSLLILNKLLFSFFGGDIAGSLFGLGQHSGTRKDPHRLWGREQTGRTPAVELAELTACSLTLEHEGCFSPGSTLTPFVYRKLFRLYPESVSKFHPFRLSLRFFM